MSDSNASDSVHVTATEFQQHFGKYRDMALSRPVFVTQRGREQLVILNSEEYRRLQRRDRRVLLAGELGDGDLEAISQAEVPAQYAHLDAELEE